MIIHIILTEKILFYRVFLQNMNCSVASIIVNQAFTHNIEVLSKSVRVCVLTTTLQLYCTKRQFFLKLYVFTKNNFK